MEVGNSGNDGNSGNPTVPEAAGNDGNSGNDEILAAIVALFTTPGTPAELSTAAVSKLIFRNVPEVTAAVLANSDTFTVTVTNKGQRLVRLRGQEPLEAPDVDDLQAGVPVGEVEPGAESLDNLASG